MTATKQERIHVHYEAIPGFSALKMKRELQEIVYRETEGMTREEVREYFRKGSEKFRKEGEERRAVLDIDSVAMMEDEAIREVREIRKRMHTETENMSPDERVRYFEEGSRRFHNLADALKNDAIAARNN